MRPGISLGCGWLQIVDIDFVDQYHFGHGGSEGFPLLETHFHIKTQRTGGVTQSVKCLPCKYDDVSFTSKTHI